MITIYLKPTNRCNVGCTHCYLPEAVRADPFRMTLDTVASVGRFADEMSRRARQEEVVVIWHGGEPLVLSPEFFFEAGAILDEALPGHVETMQTSLIPFRKEFAPLVLRRFDGGVGSSIDFSQRKLNGSVRAYHDLWMTKVDLARSEGIVVVPGVVPTRAEVGREAYVLDWFMERGFRAFNVDRYNSYGGHSDERPTNREQAGLLVGLLDAVLERMDRVGWAPMIGAVRAGVTGVLFGVGGDRWGGTCTSDFVVVEPDGSLNNCPDKSTVEGRFGVVQAGYQAFAVDRFRRRSIRHHVVDHKKSYCQSCENAHFCKSGCPITPNGVEADPAEVECSGYKTFLTHARAVSLTERGRALMVAYLEQKSDTSHVDAYARATLEPACAA